VNLRRLVAFPSLCLFTLPQVSMHALDALTQYASARRPDRDIPSDVYLLHDPHTVTVFDKFPKGEQKITRKLSHY
jgi:hypothetical protein